MMHLLARRPVRVAVALAVGGWLVAATPALASPPPSTLASPTAARHVAAETYNLDLGADLQPLFGATTLPELVLATATAYAEVVHNNFPERASALATVIAGERPMLVGLQEVALWEVSASGPYGPYTTTYDYLALLLSALAAKGMAYQAVAVNPNFTGQAPASADFATWVRYTDRNVVLARADLPAKKLTTANPMEGVFATRIPVTLPAPLPPTAITRGWASVDATVWGKTFRFVTTHLEAYGRFSGDDLFRNLQANELVALLSTSPYPLVVTGDINSKPTGCGNDNTGAYAILTATGLAESWPAVHHKQPCAGFTSGQRDLLDPANSLDHRIDDIFFSPSSFTAIHAGVIGDRQADRSVPTGFWPSDHASSLATLRMTDWSS